MGFLEAAENKLGDRERVALPSSRLCCRDNVSGKSAMRFMMERPIPKREPCFLEMWGLLFAIFLFLATSNWEYNFFSSSWCKGRKWKGQEKRYNCWNGRKGICSKMIRFSPEIQSNACGVNNWHLVQLDIASKEKICYLFCWALSVHAIAHSNQIVMTYFEDCLLMVIMFSPLQLTFKTFVIVCVNYWGLIYSINWC